MSQLFSPIAIGSQQLENRIVIPPMCQFSATDGKPTPWHLMHYGCLSHSGAGLLIVEASSVMPQGRLTPFDLGLWDTGCGDAMGGLIRDIRRYSGMPMAVQLVHAGRKASMAQPWKGERYVPPEEGGWEIVAPSAIAYGSAAGLPPTPYSTPRELTRDEIHVIIRQFAEAAHQADRAGFDMIELHGAHGYLLHQFLSPVSNRRTDEYGGSLENRMRIVLEVFQAVRAAFPKEKAVGIRVSATDWIDGGWNVDETLELTARLEALGCSFMHVSSGGLDAQQKIRPCPNYQIPLAQTVKQKTRMPVIAVGLVTEPIQAESIICTGQADMVAIGRRMMFDPHWPWHAAAKLGAQVTVPPQYLRSLPRGAGKLFK